MIQTRKTLLALTFSLLTLALTGITAATAQTFTDLHGFATSGGDVWEPQAPGAIAQGRDGQLYSTSEGGGSLGFRRHGHVAGRRGDASELSAGAACVEDRSGDFVAVGVGVNLPVLQSELHRGNRPARA